MYTIMGKTTKTTTAATKTTKAVAAPATPAKKATKKTAAAPAPAPEPVVEAAAEAAPAVEEDTAAAEASMALFAKIQQLSSMLNTLKTDFRNLEKLRAKELKTYQKLNQRKKRKSGNRAPSGFVKPTRISDELASFLGKDKGTEMARTSVTREINTYIRAHNLQDKDNGRQINPDTKLASLLKLKKDDTLTYFNLQRYMSPHFAKSVKAESSA